MTSSGAMTSSHIHTTVGNGVIIASPHDFGIRHIGIIKYRKLLSAIFISLNWPNVHKKVMKIHPTILHLLQAYTRPSP
jgi:hypothetical protein